MSNEHVGDGNPGGFTRHEGEGRDREKKPLFSTSYRGESSHSEGNEGGTGRKRPPRKRIIIKPGTSASEHSQDRQQSTHGERIDYGASRFYYSGSGDDQLFPQAPMHRKPRGESKAKKTPGKKFQVKKKSASSKQGFAKTRPKGKTGVLKKKGKLNKPVVKKMKAPYFPTVIEEPVRLNKFIAAAGVCSRRDADKLIEAGEITVNGQVITTLGARVNPGDVVMYKGQVLHSQNKYYVLLNKPKGYVTTMEDPEERQTLMELVKNACKERIFPVGRLDRNTTGLLLLTNDGELAKKLTHPAHRIRKVYEVQLDRPLLKVDMMRIAGGIELEDGIAEVDAISYVGNGEDKTKIGIELHSGKNRIVRRIFEKLHYQVKKLDRVAFGSLTKKNLPRGRWRYLTPHEVNFLKML